MNFARFLLQLISNRWASGRTITKTNGAIKMHANALDKKEITIIGFVKEMGDYRESGRIGIFAGNDFYAVKPNEEGHNLLYEVGNKVEVTGIVSSTRDGRRQIDVTGYEVFEMDEDDLEDYGDYPDNYFDPGN